VRPTEKEVEIRKIRTNEINVYCFFFFQLKAKGLFIGSKGQDKWVRACTSVHLRSQFLGF
jgi:hypothetical protein